METKLFPIHIISGDEPLLLAEACAEVTKKAAKIGFTEKTSFQVTPNFNWQEFANATNNMSLFAEKTLLELQMTAKPGVTGGKTLQNYAKNPPPDKILLVIMPKLDSATKNSKWFKSLSAKGALTQIWPIPPDKLPNWILNRLAKNGLTTSLNNAKLFTQFIEGNLLAAAQEIEKLSLIHKNGSLTTEQIIDSVTDSSRFNIFNLVDNILIGNTKKTIRILHDLKSQKTEPPLILWAITKELRSLFSMRQQIDSRKPISLVMQNQRIWAKRQPIIQSALKRHKSTLILKKLQQCAKIDRVCKGIEPGNMWDELEKLI